MTGQTIFDRALHRFALQSPRFRRFCFRRECERNGFAFDRNRENVFIAGVARAGSTALLGAGLLVLMLATSRRRART